MIRLNFPEYKFQVLEKAGKLTIFDPARKKYVALTPEEWVRQHVIQFLHLEKQVPLSLIGVESEIRLYKTRKRFDIAVFDRNGHPQLIVECKSALVSISPEVLDQVVRYNMELKVGFLMVTNGIQHIYCQVNKHDNSIKMIEELPGYSGLFPQNS